jgi:hypothetical protein
VKEVFEKTAQKNKKSKKEKKNKAQPKKAEDVQQKIAELENKARVLQEMKERPSDPVDWLANWLLKHNPKNKAKKADKGETDEA